MPFRTAARTGLCMQCSKYQDLPHLWLAAMSNCDICTARILFTHGHDRYLLRGVQRCKEGLDAKVGRGVHGQGRQRASQAAAVQLF